MAGDQGVLHTPLGWVQVRCLDGALIAVEFLSIPPPVMPCSGPCPAQALAWLGAYFACRPLPAPPPLAPAGTPFQQRVWRALAEVPLGMTGTYGELARRLGTAPRAVGGALRANPIPLLIPCHRIVAAHGLGGYDGAGESGLRRKAWLLAHEQAWVGRT